MEKSEKLNILGIIFGIVSLIANVVFIILLLTDTYIPAFSELLSVENLHSHGEMYMSRDFAVCVLVPMGWFIIWYFMAKGFMHFLSFVVLKEKSGLHAFLCLLYTIVFTVILIIKIKSWDIIGVYTIYLPFIICLIWPEFIGESKIKMSLLGLIVFLIIGFLFFLLNWLAMVAFWAAVLLFLAIVGLIVLFIMLLVAGDSGGSNNDGGITGIIIFFID